MLTNLLVLYAVLFLVARIAYGPLSLRGYFWIGYAAFVMALVVWASKFFIGG